VVAGATVVEEAAIVSQTATIEQLQGFAQDGVLYALLDACDEPSVPVRCDELSTRAVSLYRGEAETNYRNIAPYLAQISIHEFEWILTELWPNHWGYFVIARSDLSTLRTHFRRYLTVKLPDGKKVLFRFYDPRVLKTFLASSQPQEIRDFFGPARAFGVSSPGQIETVSLWLP
jgi:hypothetical protein